MFVTHEEFKIVKKKKNRLVALSSLITVGKEAIQMKPLSCPTISVCVHTHTHTHNTNNKIYRPTCIERACPSRVDIELNKTSPCVVWGLSHASETLAGLLLFSVTNRLRSTAAALRGIVDNGHLIRLRQSDRGPRTKTINTSVYNLCLDGMTTDS